MPLRCRGYNVTMIIVTYSEWQQSSGYQNSLNSVVHVEEANSMVVVSLASPRVEDVTSITLNGAPMTVINNNASLYNAGVKQWYLFNPAVGVLTVSIALSSYTLLALNATVITGDNLTATPVDNFSKNFYDKTSKITLENPTTKPCITVGILNTQNPRSTLRPKSGQTLRGSVTQPDFGQAAVATLLSSSPIPQPGFDWDVADSASHAEVMFEDNVGTVPPSADTISVVSNTSNTIGPDTDVQLGYRVKADLYYGATDILTDDTGDVYQIDGQNFSVSTGAPSGLTIFDGYINGYEMNIGERNYVSVELISFGAQLSNRVLTRSGLTTVAYNSYDPSSIARDIIDQTTSRVTYETADVPLSATATSYTFRVNTELEGLNKALELAPANWWWHINPGTNQLKFKSRGTAADHTLILGKHIKELKIGATLSALVNDVYFVGGDGGSGTVYRRSQDATSKTAYGDALEIITDGRVTTTGTADLLADNKIENFKDPKNRTTVTLSSGHYDIHSIHIGDMIAFANTGMYVDQLLLQVVDLVRSPTNLTIQLDLPIEAVNKRVEDLYRNQTELYSADVPTAPS